MWEKVNWERAGLCLLEEHKTPITYCVHWPLLKVTHSRSDSWGRRLAELPPSSTGAAETQLFRVTTKVGRAIYSVPLGVHAPMSDPLPLPNSEFTASLS